MAKKEPKYVPFVCGYPYCQKRILLPGKTVTAQKRHRDMNGFVCDGILVRYDVSPIGRAEERALSEYRKRFLRKRSSS